MDNFDRLGEPKLGNEDGPWPDNVTPTEELPSRLDTESSATMAQISTIRPLPGQGKSKKKVMLGIWAVVVVCALVGGVVWFMLANTTDISDSVAGQISDNPKCEEKPANELTLKDEIIELSVDDELVQRIWGHFNAKCFSDATEGSHSIMSSFPPLDKFYSSEGALSSTGLADSYKFAIAIQNLHASITKEPCRGNYFQWVDSTGIGHPSTGDRDCYSGDTMGTKIKEIFGSDIPLKQFDEQIFISCGEGYKYSAVYDEIVDYASGATRRLISKSLLKAERNNNRIYVYEAVGYVGCWMIGQDTCSASKLDGTEIIDSENMTVGDMRKFADYFDKFKWTFLWNGENYIFEKLERV